MNTVEQLSNDIIQLKNQLALYEMQLKEIQQQCDHRYIEEFMHQKCRKCNYVESLYY